jgi:hypothetical protein
MDYSGTLRRGWEITWRNKWLWLLALLPTLLGFVNFLITPFQEGLMGNLATGGPDALGGLAAGLLLLNCLAFIFTLVIFVVGLISRGGLVAAVARLARDEATGFGRSLGEGWRATLRLAGMTLLLYGVPVILFIVLIGLLVVPMSIAALAGQSGQNEAMAGLGVVGTVVLCCAGVALLLTMLLLGFIYPFSTRGIVLRRMGVGESIGHGWRVLRENLGEIILLALPFLLIYLLLSIVFGAAYFAIFFTIDFSSAMAIDALSILNWRFVLAFLVFGLIGAVLSAWQSAAFTLGYLQWTGKDVLGATAAPPEPLPAAPIETPAAPLEPPPYTHPDEPRL